MTNFSAALQQTLNACKSNDFTDNWDYRRFGPPSPPRLKQRLKNVAKSALAAVGMYRNDPVSRLMASTANLEWLYERLVDDESKEMLLKLLAYRTLGHRRIKLPLNNPAYWNKLAELDKRAADAESLDAGFNGWKLSKLNLAAEGYPIELFIRPPGVFTQLLIQQYRCQLPDRVIEVVPGDIVIDAGGCYGDTALYFSHKAGRGGDVYSFEFMPDNIDVFMKNMELNADLSRSVHLVDRPLWSSSGVKLFIDGVGPAAHVTPTPNLPSAKEVSTLSIDDLAQQKELPRIDFIKMDIEGAELEALKGAEESIKRYRPKLAISVYHNFHDFWVIPQWIESLGLGYRFSLRHFTIHAEETVLFAMADDLS